METPAALIEAMDSLTENHEWGGATEMLEDVLAPDDWRLKVIHDYRKQTAERDSSKVKQAEERIKHYFVVNNVNNPYAQAFILRQIGTVQVEILRITGLSKNDYYNHIGVLFRSKKDYGHLKVLDVEALLRKADLKTLLEGRQWEK